MKLGPELLTRLPAALCVPSLVYKRELLSGNPAHKRSHSSAWSRQRPLLVLDDGGGGRWVESFPAGFTKCDSWVCSCGRFTHALTQRNVYPETAAALTFLPSLPTDGYEERSMDAADSAHYKEVTASKTILILSNGRGKACMWVSFVSFSYDLSVAAQNIHKVVFLPSSAKSFNDAWNGKFMLVCAQCVETILDQREFSVCDSVIQGILGGEIDLYHFKAAILFI